MIDIKRLIPDETYILVRGEESRYLVLDIAEGDTTTLVQLDRPCIHTIAENFIFANQIHAVIPKKT